MRRRAPGKSREPAQNRRKKRRRIPLSTDPGTDFLAEHHPLLAHYRDEVLRALAGQHALLRHELAQSYEDVDEELHDPSSKVLTVPPQSQNPCKIKLIVAYVGTGQGLLELGGRQFVIADTTSVNLQGGWRLEATDVRVLSSVTLAAGVPGARGSGVSTFLYLGLFGSEIPRAGTW